MIGEKKKEVYQVDKYCKFFFTFRWILDDKINDSFSYNDNSFSLISKIFQTLRTNKFLTSLLYWTNNTRILLKKEKEITIKFKQTH